MPTMVLLVLLSLEQSKSQRETQTFTNFLNPWHFFCCYTYRYRSRLLWSLTTKQKTIFRLIGALNACVFMKTCRNAAVCIHVQLLAAVSLILQSKINPRDRHLFLCYIIPGVICRCLTVDIIITHMSIRPVEQNMLRAIRHPCLIPN